MTTRMTCVGLLIFIIVSAQSAPAFTPDATTAGSPSLIVPPFSVSTDRVQLSSLAEAESRLDAFSKSTGGHWQALEWAPCSVTPGLATGSGLALGFAVPDREAAERSARSFVLAHPDLFRVNDARLGAADVRFGRGKWSVRWREQIGGMPVLQSRVIVLLTESGTIAAFGATSYPTIAQATPPVLDAAQARRIAREHLAAMGLMPESVPLRRDEVRGPFVLPVIRGAQSGDTVDLVAPTEVEGRTILRVALASTQPLAAYDVDVDAVSGEVVQHTNVLRQEFSGTAGATLDDPNWCAGFSEHAVPNLLVTVSNAGSAVTGPNGEFSIPSRGADPETLTAAFAGPFAHVVDLEGSGSILRDVIEPDVPFFLRWDDMNSRPEERDAFCIANRTHDMIRTCDPTWTDMEFSLRVEVNYAGACNAYWGDSTVTLFHQVDNCANTARTADVVTHEYTHGVTEFLYGEDYPPLDLHEGNSDVAGNFLFNHPEIAVGFYLDDCVHGIRNSDNDLRWPEDIEGDGHGDGQIISGFHWHTRQALIGELGYDLGASTALSLWHFARSLGLPHSQPEQVWWNFLADDDDGNLDNGTPHYAALAQAAARHGFSVPETFTDVVIHHRPLLCAPSLDGEAVRVDAVLYSFAGPLDPDSLRVFYRPAGEGPFDSAPFQPTGGEDQYRALIASDSPAGSNVQYWILARDTQGHRLRRPVAGVYEFVVGVGCDDFEDVTEWTVGAPGDNAPWPGIWVIVDPNGVLSPNWGWLQPEDDATPDPGHLCWITGARQDINGTSTIVSPVYQLAGMTWGEIRYNRWFQTTNTSPGVMEIKVSYNGGLLWDVLERVAGLQDTARWTARAIELHPPGGQFGPTQFRVAMTGGWVNATDEAGFDDFMLIAGSPDPSTAPAPAVPLAGRLELRLKGANPAAGLVDLEYALPEAGPVRLTLHRVDGSLVRTLVAREMSPGPHRASWDGRDDAGHPAESGIYLARIRSKDASLTQRVLIAR